MNNTQLQKLPNDDLQKSISEINQLMEISSQLMRTPHYAKLGPVGIFIILQKARSISMCPIEALNGAMYVCNGKVELSAYAMNSIIRSKGHSISKDPNSSSEICILHGKRSDNGDIWTASFSTEDARKAGLYAKKDSIWLKYGEDLLFARALTRLARQLFPDVINGCYVEGEISGEYSNNVHSTYHELDQSECMQIIHPTPDASTTDVQCISVTDNITHIDSSDQIYQNLMRCTEEFRNKIMEHFKKNNYGQNLEGMPPELLDRLKKSIQKNIDSQVPVLVAETQERVVA